MLVVITGEMPDEELDRVFGVLSEKVLPGKAGELSSCKIISAAVKDVLLELLLIIDGDLKDLQIDRGAIIEGLPYELEVDDRLVTVEVLVLVLHLEDQLVDSVAHRDDHPVVLQQDTVDSPDHLVHPASHTTYDAISFTSIVTKSGGVPFFDRYNCLFNSPRKIRAEM